MPQHFQHYTLETSIERRTASATYLASHDDRPTQTVVLKLLHKPTFTNLVEQEKFLLEAEKLHHLNHTHIVPLLEAGVEEEQAYLVSEYIPGGSLRVRLDRSYPQQLAFPQALTIITQIGQALTYLHARYLIHGQIKPEHILFDATGRALLSDPYCSISPAPWDIRNENASNTFRYLAPEQFANESSASSDQYALCCVAYELLTGRPPFTLRDPQELLEQQKDREPTPPSQLVSNLSATIEKAVLKGLAKDPAQRHADIAAFLVALQPVQASIAIPDLPLPRSKRRTVSLAPSIPTSPPQPGHSQSAPIPSLTQSESTQALQPVSTPLSTNIPIDLPEPTLLDSALDETKTHLDIFDIDTTFEQPSSTKTLKSDVALPAISAEDDYAETFEELLQELALEEEMLIATSASPNDVVKLHEADSQVPTAASTALEEVPLPMPVVPTSLPVQTAQAPTRDNAQAGTPPKQRESVTLAATSSPSQLQPRQRPSKNNILKPSRISIFPGGGKPNWLPISKRQTTIALWSLVLLLVIGSLVTYTALAATKPTSSSLALLSATSSPTPQATIDQLSLLPASTTPTPQTIPTIGKKPPTSKPTNKATSKPTTAPTSIAAIVPITISSAASKPAPTTIPAKQPQQQPTATPIPNPAPVGQTIWLKSAANGLYVSGKVDQTNTPLFAAASVIQGWEEFRVINIGSGLIAFQMVANGNYVSTNHDEANDPLEAKAHTIAGWEKYQWINLGNGKIKLKAQSTGDYVSAWQNTTRAPLYAISTSATAWETFSWGTIG